MSDKDRTITGKKFSKVIHWNETSTQQQIDAAGGYSDFAGALKMWRDIATDYLKSKNLPYSEIVYYSPGADSWQLSPPVGNRQLSTGLIKSYIIKKRGFDPDSP